tara:strand:+ start:37 stop:318 length:282 start_codon:yes stop_codon:yes gene_type:complete
MPKLGGRHFSYSKEGIAAYKKAKRKRESTYTRLGNLLSEKDWIQGAVNPAHKGYCTPMTKSTCTPARKALAKRFKKAGRKEKKEGGTGWEGKV